MNALHFTPTDGWFGDPMPVYHNGVYHLYYTKLYHVDYRNLGWGHLVSTDMIHFEEKPDPFDENDAGGPINTGCVFPHGGKFHAYYYGVAPSGEAAMFHAESDDPDHFHYEGDICFVRPATGYRADDTWRDPFVFEYDGDFHMVFCAKAPDPTGSDNCGGVIGHAVSHDLKTWKCLPPLSPAGLGGHPECPQIFPIGDRLGLLYHWRETRFRTADRLEGPWERGDVLSPDGYDFTAARLMNDGKRNLLCGWLPHQATEANDRGWGGYFLFPREITFEDGRHPRSRFAKEVYALFPHKANYTPANATYYGEGWTHDAERMTVDAAVGGRSVGWRDLPVRSLITATVTMDKPGVLLFQLGMHPSQYLDPADDNEDGYILEISAAEGIARLYRHAYFRSYPATVATPFCCRPGEPLTVEIIRDGDLLEVGIGHQRTISTRLVESGEGNLMLRVEDTRAVIDDFAVFTE